MAELNCRAAEAQCTLAIRWATMHSVLFGSQAQGTDNANSDVDLLVDFESESTPGLLGMAAMEEELSIVSWQADIIPTCKRIKCYRQKLQLYFLNSQCCYKNPLSFATAAWLDSSEAPFTQS